MQTRSRSSRRVQGNIDPAIETAFASLVPSSLGLLAAVSISLTARKYGENERCIITPTYEYMIEGHAKYMDLSHEADGAWDNRLLRTEASSSESSGASDIPSESRRPTSSIASRWSDRNGRA
ncbi:hypothetical protein DL771_012021 [Monosporascus sp. 5C6A]|nr:hypothetical protein DL771_012021 [Monosporascus sp. 5C6A]